MGLVSTHSRLKAAGCPNKPHYPSICSFNTQPPEGGWLDKSVYGLYKSAVSTHSRLKAAGCGNRRQMRLPAVSTHSRLKAAGWSSCKKYSSIYCFNTQPPEGGWRAWLPTLPACACFNTQPPEGGWVRRPPVGRRPRGFNTQPPEGGWQSGRRAAAVEKQFQHTAA